jgi:hypothetical protein
LQKQRDDTPDFMVLYIDEQFNARMASYAWPAATVVRLLELAIIAVQ